MVVEGLHRTGATWMIPEHLLSTVEWRWFSRLRREGWCGPRPGGNHRRREQL